MSRKLAFVVALLASLCFCSQASAQESGDKQEESAEGQEQAQQDAGQAGSLRRGNRMEFDARLIRGESAGSGAVFLFERGQRPLPSMITKRKSFLRDTVGSVLGDEWAQKFDAAQNQDSDSE